MGQYQKEHTKRWAAKIDSFDAYVFVTPEYNHGTSGALKNAIDFLFKEWNNKAAGFVGYGSAGGVRAVESLRLVMGEVMVADVRAQVMLSLYTDFENFSVFKPGEYNVEALHTLLDRSSPGAPHSLHCAWSRPQPERATTRTLRVQAACASSASGATSAPCTVAASTRLRPRCLAT
jgi:hypothetical protein